MKKFAMVFATLGLALTLIGAGVAATFTAPALSNDVLHFGTLTLQLTDLNPGCGAVGTTITCNFADLSGADGSQSVSFSIKNVGTVAASSVNVTYGGNDPVGAGGVFTVSPYNPAPGAYEFGPLPAGQTHTGTWTVSWSNVNNQYQGQAVTITFDVLATA
ncbi:MAG: hypothetical protein U0869_00130 [Chloroflexota bacterium]